MAWHGLRCEVEMRETSKKSISSNKIKVDGDGETGKMKKPCNFSTYIKFIQNIFQIYLPKNTRVKAIPPKTMGKRRKEKVNDSF